MTKISKQVIVMRKDLKNFKGEKVRSGKLISQGAHASLKAVLDQASSYDSINNEDKILEFRLKPKDALQDWLNGRFTKITVSVDTLEDLKKVYKQAKDKGLPCALITDVGNTEFNGEPTITCCAIGPAWDEEIDPITGGLSLF